MSRYPESFRESPHFDAEPAHARRGVVIHHTVMPFQATIDFMVSPSSKVSYHVVISKTGERCQLVRDEHIAWHAGVSSFQGQPHCNLFMLGLAFEGDTYREPLTSAQLGSAEEWLAPRWSRYSLTPERIVDHRQVAPGRKDDLNPVEWERLSRALPRWRERARHHDAEPPRKR